MPSNRPRHRNRLRRGYATRRGFWGTVRPACHPPHRVGDGAGVGGACERDVTQCEGRGEGRRSPASISAPPPPGGAVRFPRPPSCRRIWSARTERGDSVRQAGAVSPAEPPPATPWPPQERHATVSPVGPSTSPVGRTVLVVGRRGMPPQGDGVHGSPRAVRSPGERTNCPRRAVGYQGRPGWLSSGLIGASRRARKATLARRAVHAGVWGFPLEIPVPKLGDGGVRASIRNRLTTATVFRFQREIKKRAPADFLGVNGVRRDGDSVPGEQAGGPAR